MNPNDLPQIRSAEQVLPCAELPETLDFFTHTLGFRVESVYAADDPLAIVIVGHGARIRLDRHAKGDAGNLRLRCAAPARFADGSTSAVAPNGTRIDLVADDAPLQMPPPQYRLWVTYAAPTWNVGRAGLRYRNLIPDRLGGGYIASHIQLAKGGPVADYGISTSYCFK